MYGITTANNKKRNQPSIGVRLDGKTQHQNNRKIRQLQIQKITEDKDVSDFEKRFDKLINKNNSDQKY